VLAATARVINAICDLRFILNPLVTELSVWPSLLLVIELSFLPLSAPSLSEGLFSGESGWKSFRFFSGYREKQFVITAQ
jgi:hypothetical protein